MIIFCILLYLNWLVNEANLNKKKQNSKGTLKATKIKIFSIASFIITQCSRGPNNLGPKLINKMAEIDDSQITN
jgi:hypothetical protein